MSASRKRTNTLSEAKINRYIDQKHSVLKHELREGKITLGGYIYQTDKLKLWAEQEYKRSIGHSSWN